MTLCASLQCLTIRSFYAEREDQGKYPVVTLLYGTQHREDSALWLCNDIKDKRGGDISRIKLSNDSIHGH